MAPALEGHVPGSRGQRRWLVHPVAVAVGLSAGWQWCGMKMVLHSIIAPLPGVTAMFAAVALLCAAAGPWLPECVADIVSRVQRRRRGREPGAVENGSAWMLGAIRQGDPSLSWLALAILSAVAGVIALLTTIATGLFANVYRFMLEHFFWTNLTLTAFDWLAVTLLVGVGWVLMGLIVSVLPAVARPGGSVHREPPGVLAGCIVGLGLAWFVQHALADWSWAGEQICLLGVLPLFAVAGTASKMSRRSRVGSDGRTGDADFTPEIQAGGEVLIGTAFLIWGMAVAWIAGGWLDSLRITAESPAKSPHAGYFLVLLGAAVAGASVHAHRRRQSTSGCGMAAWLAGAGAGLTATLLAFRPGTSHLQWWSLLMLVSPLGYAVHYTMRAWLARCGSELLGFELGMGLLLGGAGSGLIVAHWWALPTFGPVGTMCIASLLLMAFGGFVQIYEQDRSLRVRQRRLALVFGTLASVIVVFPADAKRWAVVEKDARSDLPYGGDLGWLALDDQAPTMRMCLIGIDPREVLAAVKTPLGRIDIVPKREIEGGPVHFPGARPHVRIRSEDAFRTMRLVRQRYDLVYYRSPAGRSTGRFAQYSLEWFRRLARCTSHGGLVYVDVPLNDLTPRAVVVITYTFEQAMDAPADWRLVDDGRTTWLRLRGEPCGGDAASDRGGAWSPVACLLEEGTTPRRHSLRRDGLTAAIESTSMSISAVERWLRAHRVPMLAGSTAVR